MGESDGKEMNMSNFSTQIRVMVQKYATFHKKKWSIYSTNWFDQRI